jgi:hypothetical protein
MDLPPALEFRTKVQNPDCAGYIEIEEDDDLALALEQLALRGSHRSPERTGGDPDCGGVSLSLNYIRRGKRRHFA